MKRPLGSLDSLDAFMSICQTTTEEKTGPRSKKNFLYGGAGDLPSILAGLDDEESFQVAATAGEKKRRLSVDQVRGLEKNFEIQNKLEPERKVKLASELGLQPRQVAVWFQNRRARWKSKQLDRDYGVLKAEYDSLKLSHDALQRDNNAVLEQIRELKAKLNEEETTISINISVHKQEHDASICAVMATNTLVPPLPPPLPPHDLNYETIDILPRADGFRDGPSDNHSSAVLNDNSPTTTEIPTGFFLGQFMKMEELGNLFDDHDEQWYCSDQWN